MKTLYAMSLSLAAFVLPAAGLLASPLSLGIAAAGATPGDHSTPAAPESCVCGTRLPVPGSRATDSHAVVQELPNVVGPYRKPSTRTPPVARESSATL